MLRDRRGNLGEVLFTSGLCDSKIRRDAKYTHDGKQIGLKCRSHGRGGWGRHSRWTTQRLYHMSILQRRHTDENVRPACVELTSLFSILSIGRASCLIQYFSPTFFITYCHKSHVIPVFSWPVGCLNKFVYVPSYLKLSSMLSNPDS